MANAGMAVRVSTAGVTYNAFFTISRRVSLVSSKSAPQWQLSAGASWRSTSDAMLRFSRNLETHSGRPLKASGEW
jgi:hypothetical protein